MKRFVRGEGEAVRRLATLLFCVAFTVGLAASCDLNHNDKALNSSGKGAEVTGPVHYYDLLINSTRSKSCEAILTDIVSSVEETQESIPDRFDALRQPLRSDEALQWSAEDLLNDTNFIKQEVERYNKESKGYAITHTPPLDSAMQYFARLVDFVLLSFGRVEILWLTDDHNQSKHELRNTLTFVSGINVNSCYFSRLFWNSVWSDFCDRLLDIDLKVRWSDLYAQVGRTGIPQLCISFSSIFAGQYFVNHNHIDGQGEDAESEFLKSAFRACRGKEAHPAEEYGFLMALLSTELSGLGDWGDEHPVELELGVFVRAIGRGCVEVFCKLRLHEIMQSLVGSEVVSQEYLERLLCLPPYLSVRYSDGRIAIVGDPNTQVCSLLQFPANEPIVEIAI